MDILNGKKLFLASSSPRRKELLEKAQIPFELMVKEVEEIYPDDLAPEEVPSFLAKLKAEPFRNKLRENEIVLTSDTIVIINGKILGKPKSKEDAQSMLRSMADKEHTVVTGVNIMSNDREIGFSDVAKVQLFSMAEEEINWYIDNFKPFDKAGSYGIQDWIGYVKIKRITGSYATIMGLPIAQVYHQLRSFCLS